jgi:small subunit ribosomal protein S23
MGRINLAALRVRRRALTNQQTGKTITPVWINVTRDIPPAQILVRKQPQQHRLTRVRTETFEQITGLTQSTSIRQTLNTERHRTNPKRLYCPQPIRYEEDELRTRFFSDHPWELARPRVVLEDTGDSHARADWSKGLIQAGIPLSGESVVQRQLYLLQTVPNIKVDAAYDIARKEFYDLRRQEEVRTRIAAEEAESTGAVFGKTPLQWGIQVENTHYDDWERWAKEQVVLQGQKSAAFAGNTVTAEEDALAKTGDLDGGVGPDGREQLSSLASTLMSRPSERRRTPIGKKIIE